MIEKIAPDCHYATLDDAVKPQKALQDYYFGQLKKYFYICTVGRSLPTVLFLLINNT